MNLTISEALRFAKNLARSTNQVIVAAPFTFLASLRDKVKRGDFRLAAQDVSEFEVGAYTGDVSAKMLKEVGCSYCLVGHSERRIYHHETDSQINNKIKNLLKHKIKPVLCLGENEEQKARGQMSKVLKEQLLGALAQISDPFQIIIAYEPVWAISTFQKSAKKKAASEKDIVLAHLYIRNLLVQFFGKKAGGIKILYGGTVNKKNSAEIFSLKQVDGALVGNSSLKISDFNAIIKQ